LSGGKQKVQGSCSLQMHSMMPLLPVSWVSCNVGSLRSVVVRSGGLKPAVNPRHCPGIAAVWQTTFSLAAVRRTIQQRVDTLQPSHSLLAVLLGSLMHALCCCVELVWQVRTFFRVSQVLRLLPLVVW
jgi:hypothetical protein